MAMARWGAEAHWRSIENRQHKDGAPVSITTRAATYAPTASIFCWPAACVPACWISFKPYLHDRLADGERNATVLHVEIAERGYTGGYKTLARYLQPLRRVDAAALAGLSPHPGPPAVRQVAGWITGLPGHLDPADSVRLHAIRCAVPSWTPP